MNHRTDLKDACVSEIAAELKERGWRIVPSWVFGLLSAGVNTGYWSTPEMKDEE